MNNEKLNFDGQTEFAGNFVLQNQKTSDDEGFSKVSKLWYDHTSSYEEGLKQIAVDQSKRTDLMVHPNDLSLVIEDKTIFLKVGETQHSMTNHAIGGFLRLASRNMIGGMPATGLLKKCTNSAEYFSTNQVKLTCPSESMEELFRKYLEVAEKELRDKEYLVRIQDGSVRAFLSENYETIDNGWFIETLANILPNGRLSHFDKSTADTVCGNILISDTLLNDEDSDYGGMLNITNCEIGTRRCGITPSIFRAICMNGCIWDQKKGEQFSVVHRGTINLDELRDKMERHIACQLDLIPEKVRAFLSAKQWKLTAKPSQVFAEIKKQLGLTKTAGLKMAQLWQTEENGDKTAFAIMNGMTRGSQTLHPEDWDKVDRFVGTLITKGEKAWNSFDSRAKTRSEDWVKKVLA